MNWKDTFYKPLKIKNNPHDILVWGCIHHSHDPIHWEDPIWNQRGYKSAKECDDGLISNWNSRANNDNTIGFLLGDNCFGNGGADKFKNLLRRLNFKEIYCCAGNHYAAWWQLFEEAEGNEYILDGVKKITFMPNYFEAFINGKPVVCSHYPLISWNGQGGGSYHVHSHTHGQLKNSKLGRDYKNSGARVYEVSVEENPFPISWAELDAKLSKLDAISFDGHGATTQNPF